MHEFNYRYHYRYGAFVFTALLLAGFTLYLTDPNHGVRLSRHQAAPFSGVPEQSGTGDAGPVFTDSDAAIKACDPAFADRITDRFTWTPMWICHGHRVTDAELEATIPPNHQRFGRFVS